MTRARLFVPFQLFAPSKNSARTSRPTRLISGWGWNRQVGTALVVLLASTMLPAALASQPAAYDLLIRGGRVLDGSGNPWLAADLAIRDGRIAAMGRLGDAAAARVIDARGLTVGPG